MVRVRSKSDIDPYKCTARPYVALLLVAASVLTTGTPAAARRKPGTGLGPIAFDRPAPDFAFDALLAPAPDPATAVVPKSLAALRGRPIVLNFWASYCEPCVDELDAFAKLRKTYGESVTFVTVSDQPGDVIADALRAKRLDAIAIADPDRKIFGLYGVSAIPVTLVLAPDETVKYVSVGELDWNELRTAVQAVLPPGSQPPADFPS